MVKYENRYGEVYTFTKLENGNVLWEGNFEHIRVGCPNVYKEAYQQFRKDGGYLNQHDFEEEVHKQLYDEDGNWIKGAPITEKYGKLVYSDHDNINMVDPSGGPFIKEHFELGVMFGEELDGLCVRSFVYDKDKGGYEIQTYGEFDHLEESKLIGGLSV